MAPTEIKIVVIEMAAVGGCLYYLDELKNLWRGYFD